jgi:hypothetical protein
VTLRLGKADLEVGTGIQGLAGARPSDHLRKRRLPVDFPFLTFLKSGKPHRDGRAFAEFAYHLHLPAVEVGAAFHKQQTESRARPSSYVATAMEGFEKLLLIFLRNANLLSNAVKYSEPGATVHFLAERNGPDAVCVIRDQGIGIPGLSPNEFASRIWLM